MKEEKPKWTYDHIKQAGTLVMQGVNQLLWPAVCIICRQSIGEIDKGLCRDCWDELMECTGSDYCRRCGRDTSKFAVVKGVCPDCQGREICFDGIARVGVYDQSLRRMILAFKNGATELDSILGSFAGAALQGSGFYAEIELFVPVPLHWTRRLARGYNQSRILAGKLKHPKAGISKDLVRIRRTRTQPSAASPTARAKNVAGAFAVTKRHRFAGRKVCLVDDIKTSGATLNECARTLRQAGASKVFALVLAVAGQNPG